MFEKLCPSGRRAWARYIPAFAVLLWSHGAFAQGPGGVWTSAAPMPAPFDALATSSGTSSVAYALSNERVFKSTDRWATWTESTTAPEDMVELAHTSSEPDRVYGLSFGAISHIYRSDDGAETWTALTNFPAGESPDNIYLVPTNPPALLVTTASFGLFRSVDGGESWDDLGDLPSGGFLEYHPSNPNILWHVGVTLSRSTDLGQTWTEVGLPVDGFPRQFTLDPTNPSRAWSATAQTLFRTDDGGASWLESGTLPDGALTLEALDDRLVLLVDELFDGVTGNLAQSLDGGQTWQELPVADELPVFLRWIPEGSVLVGTGHEGFSPLMASWDRGQTWQSYGGSISTEKVSDIAWVGVDRQGLMTYGFSEAFGDSRRQTKYSTDGGLSWLRTALPREANPTVDMAVDPFDPRNILMTHNPTEIFRSTDGGATWMTHGAPGFINGFAFDPGTPGRVLAATDLAILLSNDGGVTWSFSTNPMPELVSGLTFDPEDPQRVFAYDRFSFTQRSADGGMTWSLVPGDPSDLRDLVFDTQDPDTLYALDFVSDLFRSVDDGASWQRLTNTPRLGQINTLAQDNQGVLWIAHSAVFGNTDLAPYWSADRGNTWSRLDTGLPETAEILHIATHPDGRLAVGTVRHGVYLLNPEGCTADATTACLLGGKFRVEASQQSIDQPSTSVVGRVMQFDTARAESEQSVFFESFQDGNFEVGVKMVDACGLPEGNPQRAYWAFFGGLTNAGTTIRIEDRTTGESYTWESPAGEFALTLGDTNALPCEVDNPPPPVPCEASAGTACLFDGRFQVTGSMQSFDDPPATVPVRVMDFAGGRAESDQSVFFESFQAGNFELGVKMVDACGLPNDNPLRAYWAFYGGLTNAESRVVVTQVGTGAADTWTVAAGMLPRSEGRTSAFACE